MVKLYYQQKESGDTMSANVYSVQSLLIGTEYQSRTLTGKIVNAEPHPKAVWYEGCDSYLVEVRPTHGLQNQYRTVAVKVGE
jgi:hypothetical protein